MSEKNYVTPYDLEGRLPMKQAIPLGLQHVMAMFAGNLTPILIIGGSCGIAASGDFAPLMISLIQNAMIIAGVVTLIQVFTIGPIGGKVPIIMGTSSGFIGVFKGVTDVMGGGLIGYGAIMGASLIGGLVEGVLGICLKPLRRFFPATVTGTVVITIGMSLITVGIKSFGGGATAKDYGSLENLALGTFVICVILGFKHWTKGIMSASSILIGIIAGYIACAIMGMFLPTTAVTPEGVEFTKSWVLQTERISSARWFELPTFMPVDLIFDPRAIVPVILMYIVTAVETVGDISGVMTSGLNREATDKELSGGVSCDGFGSALAAMFGVLPNTSFSQNVGLVGMTKIVNQTIFLVGSIFLILCGLLPKLAALVAIMPQSVLGGAAVIMFASIILSGIQLIYKDGLSNRNMTIVSVALGLGFGLGNNMDVLQHMPESIRLIFGGSGIVPATVVAILLNIILPEDKEEKIDN